MTGAVSRERQLVLALGLVPPAESQDLRQWLDRACIAVENRNANLPAIIEATWHLDGREWTGRHDVYGGVARAMRIADMLMDHAEDHPELEDVPWHIVIRYPSGRLHREWRLEDEGLYAMVES